MHKMMELRAWLNSELDKIIDEHKMNRNTLWAIKKLTSSIKNIDTIVAMEKAEHKGDEWDDEYVGSHEE